VASDQASLAALCPSRERLVRIATMIRDAERSTPDVRPQKRRGRDAALIPLPVRRRAVRRPYDAVVDLAS
jgi:hypothetical protein